MRVLVTGATGFLGSHLVRRLARDGHAVRILCRESSDLSALAGLDVELAQGDVTDEQSVLSATQDVSAVFHAAGLVAYARAARAAMHRVNVGGTANIVDACARNGVDRLVHVSSVVAVGAGFTPDTLLNEDSPYNLAHLNLGYFETKRAAEEIVFDAARQGRIDAVSINPSTIYGAGDARKGSRRTQLKVAQGRFPFYTDGGVNVIAVEDVVEAICVAWRLGRSGQRYIVAGENLLIRDLLTIIAREAGVEPPRGRLRTPLVRALGRMGDTLERWGLKPAINYDAAVAATLYHWFDNSKARAELGLEPRPAQQAIAASVAWMREQGMLESPKIG